MSAPGDPIFASAIAYRASLEGKSVIYYYEASYGRGTFASIAKCCSLPLTGQREAVLIQHTVLQLRGWRGVGAGGGVSLLYYRLRKPSDKISSHPFHQVESLPRCSALDWPFNLPLALTVLCATAKSSEHPPPPSPPPRPSEGGWCEAAGRYGVSRSTWKDSTGVSGQDATHRHPGLSSIRIGKCAGWRRRIKISVDGGGVERAASEQTRFTRRCLLQREPFNVAVRSAAPSFRLSWLTII